MTMVSNHDDPCSKLYATVKPPLLLVQLLPKEIDLWRRVTMSDAAYPSRVQCIIAISFFSGSSFRDSFLEQLEKAAALRRIKFSCPALFS